MMEQPGKRKQGRPKISCIDSVRDDMAVAEVTGKDADDTTKCRQKIHCDDPPTGTAERGRI